MKSEQLRRRFRLGRARAFSPMPRAPRWRRLRDREAVRAVRRPEPKSDCRAFKREVQRRPKTFWDDGRRAAYKVTGEINRDGYLRRLALYCFFAFSRLNPKFDLIRTSRGLSHDAGNVAGRLNSNVSKTPPIRCTLDCRLRGKGSRDISRPCATPGRHPKRAGSRLRYSGVRTRRRLLSSGAGGLLPLQPP
jgi:hypothetical protein